MTFNATSLPLASPFLGASGLYGAYGVGDDTGTYVVSYTALVRGDYAVTVMTPPRWETQLIQTRVDETGENLSGEDVTYMPLLLVVPEAQLPA